MNMQVMKTRKRVLGEEHPGALVCTNDLAITLEEQGRKGEAIKLMAECVQLRSRVLGTEHPFFCCSAGKMAEYRGIQELLVLMIS